MDIIIAAMVVVFFGAIVLAVLAAMAYCMLWFLLLFWPAIAGMTLTLLFIEAEMDVAAVICLVGGIAGNIIWWIYCAVETPPEATPPSTQRA